MEFYGNSRCEESLDWLRLIERIESAMKDFSASKCSPLKIVDQPVRSALALNPGFLLAMPCYSKSENALSVKLVSLMPENKAKFGLSTHIVYVALFDAETGALNAIMVRLTPLNKIIFL